MTRKPVERKVYAATVGGGLGTALSGFIVWLTGVLFFGGSSSADAVQDTVTAVPAPVSVLELLAVGAAVPFVAGYLAKTTKDA